MTCSKSTFGTLTRFLCYILCLSGLTACGGGGGGSPAIPTPTTFTVQGSIIVAAGSLVDSDINNSSSANISNNSPGSAQEIPSFVVLGGYANEAMQGENGPLFESGDNADYFSVYLYNGQSIVLDIHDSDNADLDLYLLTSTGLTVLDSSLSTGTNESLNAPFEGEFQLLVEAFSGASSYTLRTEQTVNIDSSNSRLSDAFIPHEIILKFREPHLYKQEDQNPESTLNQLNLNLMNGQTDRAMRMSQGSYDYDAREFESLSNVDSLPVQLRHQFTDQTSRAKHETLLAIKQLNRDFNILYAEPNLLLEATAIPNDPRYNEQWHFPLLELPAAWDITTGSSDVIVAVVDSGALFQHPDLSGNLIAGYDFVSSVGNALDGNGIDPNAEDVGSSFHGSHVAGIIAGMTDNGIGTSGISWQSKIMPLRVLGGTGGNLYDATQAMRYAAGLSNDSGELPATPADIINLSIGGTGFCPSSYRDVLSEVRQQDILVVAAAGNDNESSSQFYPANCNDVIAVSAVDQNKVITDYSNFGNTIDIAAPGGRDDIDNDMNGFLDAILSTSARSEPGGPDYRYDYRTGTSMATPHVSGVFALMLTVNPALTADEIEQMLISGLLTDDIGIAGADSLYGNGLINARKAVAAAIDSLSGTDSLVSYLSSSISTIEFRPSQTETEFETRVVGDDAITVNSIDIAANWLDLVSLGQSTDGETWRMTVDRLGLSEGLYSETISFNTSANILNIEVILQVNPPDQHYEVGPLLVNLRNVSTQESRRLNLNQTNNSYIFNFSNLASGQYRIEVFTDLNGNGLADSGEATTQSEDFTINGNTNLPAIQLDWDSVLSI